MQDALLVKIEKQHWLLSTFRSKRQKRRQDRNVKRIRAKALYSPTLQQNLSQTYSSSFKENGKKQIKTTKPLREMVKARKIKNTKKRQALTSEVCSLDAKYFLSNRQVYEMVGAATAEHNLEDKILYVNNVRRKQVKFFAEAEKNFLANELVEATDFYTLHWIEKYSKLSSLFWQRRTCGCAIYYF